MKEIYLDNSATTKVRTEVAELMVETMTVAYGNPSSMHHKGVEAEKYIKEAKERLANIWKADLQKDKIYFTSCGTEADNLAIIGGAMGNKRAGMHIITTSVEHPAVKQACAFLEEQGFRVTYLPVDELGRVRVCDFEAALCEDTILVSMMHVNNEIGAVMPIAECAALLHERCPKALFHTDAVQSFGKYRILPKRMGIDMISVSGHKIHGPKGIGALYVRNGVKLKPILFGGGQQEGMRSGTESVPGIAALGLAAALCYRDLDQKVDTLYKQKAYFIDALKKMEGVYINGDAGLESAPHIVSVSFDGIDRAEVLLHALEDYGIYVSSGSACSTNKPGLSETLQGIGLDAKRLTATLRFSFSEETTYEELDETIAALNKLLPMLRRFRKR